MARMPVSVEIRNSLTAAAKIMMDAGVKHSVLEDALSAGFRACSVPKVQESAQAYTKRLLLNLRLQEENPELYALMKEADEINARAKQAKPARDETSGEETPKKRGRPATKK